MAKVTINGNEYTGIKRYKRIYSILNNLDLNEGFSLFTILKNKQFASINQKILNDCSIHLFREFSRAPRKAYLTTAIVILRYINKLKMDDLTIKIQHSVSDGVYGEFRDTDRDIEELIESLDNHFKAILKKNYRIIPSTISRTDAIQYFENNDMEDTAKLLQHCSQNFLTLFEINDHRFWTPFPVAPFTGLINTYDIVPYQDGFIFRCPPVNDPATIPELQKQDKLFKIFEEFVSWGEILDLSNIYDINESIINNEMSDIIKISEALHAQKIAYIADEIITNDKRFAFISGPSASGKTSFSKRLSVQLRAQGYKTVQLSIDDYFKDRAELRKEQGESTNFEVLEAVDIELLNQDLQKMVEGGEIEVPKYDFKTGEKELGHRTVNIDDNTFILFEGIHAINPKLTPGLPSEYKYLIYVSALTHLNFDNTNRISTHDMRLIRRIVRDARYRGYSAERTIQLWDNVVKAEHEYIFPYQRRADIMFNSSLVYETSILKNDAERFLKTVSIDSDSYPTANRLLDILSYFLPMKSREIPSTSIIREFIGGSSFKF